MTEAETQPGVARHQYAKNGWFAGIIDNSQNKRGNDCADGATMDNVYEAIEIGADGFAVTSLNPASVLDKVAMCLKIKG